jgi:hypothetical protein
MNKHQQYIRVEYDEDFFGGNYSKTGSFALVKLVDVNSLGSVEAAFKASTGIETIHIIHYSLDELYDADGELWEE